MLIDLEVALRTNRQIDAGVFRQQLEHVVEKPHAGGDLGLSRAVEIELDGHVSFIRLPRDAGRT